jgi:glycosyltransferase involved in cell wall biosynthesis
MKKISVAIRNKNQSSNLNFLLKNLTERYNEIDEIIVIDNRSIDNSKEITEKYGAKFITIEKFSYGGSANLAAQSAKNEIIVIFSAHAFPVSEDFFQQILKRFENNDNLAGLRCLHNFRDYKHYINKVSSKTDPNVSGLIFCGSAFNKRVWEKYSFKSDIQTMEDKEWTIRVLKNNYDIEFSPSIFCYDITRTPKELFFRFKNETIGGYQLWHSDYNLKIIFKSLIVSLLKINKNYFIDIFYAFKRFFFLLKFNNKKPEKFEI